MRNPFKRQPAEPMMTVAEHERIVSQLRADVTVAELAYEAAHQSHRRVAIELAAMKAKRVKSNRNLIPGGPKRKAQVMAERAQETV